MKNVHRREVGQHIALEVVPEGFNWVEFWGVGGKMFNLETRVPSEELLHEFALIVMGG